MLRKWTFAVVIGCVMGGRPAQAAPVPLFTGAGSVQPFRSFEDDRGGFYVVWVSSVSPKGITLVSQHFDSLGRPLWKQPGLLISSQATSATDWSGLADGQGGLTLFWDEADGVRAQRYTPEGIRRRHGNSVLLSTSTAIQPDAVPDAVGGTLVVWRNSLTQNRSVIMAQRLDADGKPAWAKGGVRVSLRASHQTNPRIVYDNMSGMIVAWRDESNEASELRVQRIDFAGNRLWTLEGLKVTAPVGVEELPMIASVGTGSVLVAWAESVAQASQIRLQEIGPGSSLQWANPVYASNGQGTFNRWNPLLHGDEAGGAWVAWEDSRNQLNYQMELNHLDSSGTPVWPSGEMAIAPAPGDQGKAAMVGNGNKGVWLAWIDNRLSTVGLYVQEIDRSGRLLLGGGGRLIADRLSKPSHPQLVSLAPGKAAVVWAQRPSKDQWILYWDLIETP